MTRHRDDWAVRRFALNLTPRTLAMQERLFRPVGKCSAPVSDAAMTQVLREIRAASELNAFRIWLIGSRVYAGRFESDIDLVLSPAASGLPSEHEIERALWYCREYGLRGANPACIVDPCFRESGPALDEVPLQPDAELRTVKLLSPRLIKLVRAGRIRQCRRVGDVSIEFVRLASETDFYRKLPKRQFGHSVYPYLRPAIEVSSGLFSAFQAVSPSK